MTPALSTTETRRPRSLKQNSLLCGLCVSVVKLSAVLLLALPCSASACAVCFGNSDSPWAKALNWGILVLLFVVLTVLGGIVAFFMHMAKRARMTQLSATQEEFQP